MLLPKINDGAVFKRLAPLALSNTVLQILGFIYRVFLSRNAGAEGIGVYQLLLPFYSVLNSLTLGGVAVITSKKAAEFASCGNYFGARKVLKLSRRIFFALIFCVFLFCFFNSDFIARDVLCDERCEKSIFPLLLCLFLTGIENLYKSYFYGVGKVFPQIVSELSEQAMRFAAAAVFLLYFKPDDAGESAFLIICGMVVSEFLSSSLLSLFFKPEKARLSSRTSAPVSARDVFFAALPVSGALFANHILSAANAVLLPQRLSAFGLSHNAATEQFGVMFGMTLPLVSFPVAFIASVASVMVPEISEALAVSNIADARRKAAKTVHATALFAFPCTAVFLPIGRELARAFFNNPLCGEYIELLSVAAFFSYFELTLIAVLNGAGMQKRTALYIAVSGICQLVFTWFAKSAGMPAFVWGHLFSSALCAGMCFMRIKRAFSLSVRFSNWFLRPAAASAACAVCTKLLFGAALPCGTLAAAAVSVSGGLFAYFGVLYALGTNFFGYIKTLTVD